MTDIINFRKKDNNIESVSLRSWTDYFHSDEELREVFLNMDRAMKYIHDRGYCVKSFNPKEIEILNNSLNQIKFNTLLEMPKDELTRREMIREDIYNSSFVQIGTYTKCLEYLQPKFLKENFDSFATFLPEGDVPYYRGVIQRGANVYFCEYDLEKRKKDLELLEKEVGEESGFGNGRSLVKSNGKSIYDPSSINDSINNSIYRQINNKGEAAFINFLLYPMIVLVLGVLIAFVAWVVSLG